MQEIGIRELKQRASQILRRLCEDKTPVIITHRGKAIAQLVPIQADQLDSAQLAAWLAKVDELAKEIGSHWPAGVTAVDAVREQRREL